MATKTIQAFPFKVISTSLILLGVIWSLGFAQVAVADSFSTYFSCTDNSPGVTVTPNNQNHTMVAKCTSGSTLNYLTDPNLATAAVTVTCPSGQSVGDSVKNLNAPNDQITFYCEQVVGHDSNGDPIYTHTSTTPTAKQDNSKIPTPTTGAATKNSCGDPNGTFVNTSIDLGCRHQGNPILDLTFAIVRLLSDGVGIVLVGSMVWAGIQYTSSRGDPNATAQAINRIRSNVIALLLFIFAYAILNYVIPGQFLK